MRDGQPGDNLYFSIISNFKSFFGFIQIGLSFIYLSNASPAIKKTSLPIEKDGELP